MKLRKSQIDKGWLLGEGKLASPRDQAPKGLYTGWVLHRMG